MRIQLFLTTQRVIYFCLLLSAASANGQQITPKTIQLNTPTIINFKELADYRLSHPIKHPKRYIEQGEDREHGRTFKPHTVPGNPPVFNVPSNTERAGTGVSPSPRIVFNGILSNQTDFPPDINGAVGDNYILETTNQEFDIYTKSGAFNSVIDIPTLFASQNGTYLFDPHVEYDDIYKRFVIISDGFYTASGDGAIFIAVSKTSDPTGFWYIYSFDGIGNANDFLDYPLLGYNNKWIVITGNDFLSSGGTQTNIYVLNRANLYKGALGTVKEFSDGNYISITPTKTYDTTEANDYLVQDINGDQGGVGYIQIGTISGPVATPVYSAGTALGVNSPWSDNPTNGATQLGGTYIESGLDTKIENSLFRNGSLWLTHTVYVPAASPTHSAADWWQINPTAHTVTQFGRIEDPNGIIDYYYPSINVDANGDALVGYCTSSPSTYASAEYSYRASTDTKNTMQTGYLFKPGEANYALIGGGRNRYGDFTYTCIDPSDNSFWTFQEFAASPANTWGTVIANIGGAPCASRPTAGTITTLVDTVCNGEGTILNLIGNTSNSNGIHIAWQQSSNGINWTGATGGIGDTSANYSTAPLSSATYFRSIIKCLNSTLSDTSAPIKVVIPGVTSVSNDTVCIPGNYSLIAHGLGSKAKWYRSSSGGSAFFTGDTLKTFLSKDTIFYVNNSISKHYSLGVYDDSYGLGSYFNGAFSDGLLFSAISNFILDSLYVYASSTGSVTVNLINTSTNTPVGSATITITGPMVDRKTVVHTNFNCIAGTNYNITAAGTTVSQLFRTSSDANYPYVLPGIASITAPNNAATGHYYFFYDWHVTTTCTSALMQVNVAVGSLALRARATPDTLCSGKNDSVLLSVTGGKTYQWTPGNSTDSLLYVKPTTNTTYTVSGNYLSCTGTTHVVVNVENCTAVNTISSTNPTIVVYPNPTTGQFELTMNNLPEQLYTVALYNILGQKILTKQISINSSHYTLPVNVSALPSGLYFVRVNSGNQEWTQRITKR